ncbi:hypothetical protein PAXINDRAFT_169646 [Paxillus involutus ATCC 200175]|uniref:Uncharacterized protein n=1 Tax=Paxillus involutus ATCC 200175 TaxID=664439 RepID=A0A0C9U6J0_PAXIN|nr:hypothetical protein PAXINDRAFT_169646 [Paxillus involutus ATCC 200175]
MEASLTEKYDEVNAHINNLVQVFQACRMTADDLLSAVLVNIVAEAPQEACMKMICRRDECMKLIKDNPGLANTLQSAIADRHHDYQDVMFLPILQQEDVHDTLGHSQIVPLPQAPDNCQCLCLSVSIHSD